MWMRRMEVPIFWSKEKKIYFLTLDCNNKLGKYDERGWYIQCNKFACHNLGKVAADY